MTSEPAPSADDQPEVGPARPRRAPRRPLHVDVGPERLGVAIEGAAYFAVTECLAALPAGAPRSR